MNKPYCGDNDEEAREDLKVDKRDKYSEEFYYKILNKNRYILLYDEINNMSAEMVCAKLRAMNYLDKNIPITTSLVNALKDMDKPKNPISIRYHVLNNCWCVFSKDKLMSLRTKVQCLKYIMGLQEKRIYPHYTFFMGEIVDENVMSKELHGFFKREGVTL